MGTKPTKVMIVRHAEKHGHYPLYGTGKFEGVNKLGFPNKGSLITLGWERGGGIANLFWPSPDRPLEPHLAKPDFLFASNPDHKPDNEDPSRRPYETLLALSTKSGLTIQDTHRDDHYVHMIEDVLERETSGPTCTVLIAWQHQYILPKAKATFAQSLVATLMSHGHPTTPLKNVPIGPWPSERYDMVFVFDRPSGSGPFTHFKQVPQLLLAGDSPSPIDVFHIESASFPGVFLRMNSEGHTELNPAGFGQVNCQFTPGPFEQFRIVDAADGSGTFNIESVQFPGVFLRMDATIVTTSNPGTVNCQGTPPGPFEKFRITSVSDAISPIESVAFPGAFLCMNGEGFNAPNPAGGGKVYCQLSPAGPWTQFRMTRVYQSSS